MTEPLVTSTTEARSPRTEAGKAIMAGWDQDTSGDVHEVTRGFIQEIILAIEDESARLRFRLHPGARPRHG
jgi:hypothetical protein